MKTMKTKKLLLFLTVIFSVFILISSCQETGKNYQKNSYLAGDMLSNYIIQTYYQAHNKLNYSNSYRQELAYILKGEIIDSVEVSNSNLVENFEVKINLFSAYRELMIEMQTKKNASNEDIVTEINTVLNFVDSLNDSTYSPKIKEIRDYISSYKYDLNSAVFEITDLVFKIWENDVISWINKLNKSYNLYAKTVDSIPTDIFDEDKLQKYVYEPYKDKQTLVNIYKLNMKQDAYEQKSIFLDKATNLKAIFSRLRNVFLNIYTEETTGDTDFYLIEHILSELKNYDKNTKK